MKDEVNSAIEFLCGFLKKAKVSRADLERFKECLGKRMTKRYEKHWHPLKPQRGCAYRSIIIDHDCVDPLITGALSDASKNPAVTVEILSKFPKDLMLWVDPMEVSYKFGEHGSIGVVYDGNPDSSSDYESDTSSVNSSPCSSPPIRPHEYRQQPAHSIPTYHHLCGQEAKFFHSPFPNRYHNGMETTAA